MTNYSFKKQSYVKCHILELSTDNDIIRKVGIIKRPYLLEIQEKIKKAIF